MLEKKHTENPVCFWEKIRRFDQVCFSERQKMKGKCCVPQRRTGRREFLSCLYCPSAPAKSNCTCKFFIPHRQTWFDIQCAAPPHWVFLKSINIACQGCWLAGWLAGCTRRWVQPFSANIRHTPDRQTGVFEQEGNRIKPLIKERGGKKCKLQNNFQGFFLTSLMNFCYKNRLPSDRLYQR